MANLEGCSCNMKVWKTNNVCISYISYVKDVTEVSCKYVQYCEEEYIQITSGAERRIFESDFSIYDYGLTSEMLQRIEKTRR